MTDLVAVAEQLSAEVAAVPGVETVYARRGLVAVALDVVARVASGTTPAARVTVHDRGGLLEVEANVGVSDDVPAAVTAALVHDRILELLRATGQPAKVTVRVASIG